MAMFIAVLILVNLSIVFCQNCSMYFDKETRILEIPSTAACFLVSEQVWNENIIQHIKIHGIVSVRQEIGLHVKYKYFSMSETGVLAIGEQDSSFPHEVVFEQEIDDTDCESSIPYLSQEGRISMKSYKQGHMLIHKKISQRQTLRIPPDFKNEYTEEQDFIVIDFDQTYPKISYSKIFEIYNSTLHPYDYLNVKPSSFERISKPLFISSLHQSKGIRFINTCSSLRFDNIIGAQFINPKYLLLTGDSISNSLFITTKRVPQQRVEINSEITNCTFIGVQRINLRENFNVFVDSVFLNSTINQADTELFLEGTNYFINSQIDFSYKKNKAFENLTLSNSNLTIKSSQLCKELSFNTASFIHHSKLILSLELEQLLIKDSTFVDSSIIIEEMLLYTAISNTFVYKASKEIQFIKIGQGSLNSIQKQKIYFNNCTIIGDLYRLISSEQKTDNLQTSEQGHTRCLEKGYFTISITEDSLINNLVPEDSQSFQIFNLPCKGTNFKYREQYLTIYKIETYNRRYPHMMKQHFRYLAKDEYLLQSPPAYLLIREATFLQTKFCNTIRITANINSYFLRKEYYEIFQIQLMPNWPITITFLHDDKDELEVLHLSLQLINYSQTDFTNQVQYQVRFNRMRQHSIRDFTVKNVSFLNERIDFKLEKQIDYFKLVWNSGDLSRTDFDVAFNICELKRINYEQECIEACDRTPVENYCFDSCSSENSLFYHHDQSKCLSCSEGCSQCSSQDNCGKCEDGYHLLSGLCVTGCGETFFYQDGECKQCSRFCSSCDNEIKCNVCSNNETNHSCFYCNEGYYFDNNSTCLPCSPLCDNCFGMDRFQCTKCSADAVEKYGLCLPSGQ